MTKDKHFTRVPVPAYREEDVPEGAMRLAENQTRHLLNPYLTGRFPLTHLLASAYLQGINDVTQVMFKDPARWGAVMAPAIEIREGENDG